MFLWKRFIKNAQAICRPRSSPARRTGCSDDVRIGMMIVTQDSHQTDLLRAIASRRNWEVTSVQSCDDAVAILKYGTMPLVICDQDLPDANWRDSLRRMANIPQPICLLLACRAIDPNLLREVVHCHGYDAVPKPFRAEDLVRYVSLAWTWHRSGSTRQGQSDLGRRVMHQSFRRVQA